MRGHGRSGDDQDEQHVEAFHRAAADPRHGFRATAARRCRARYCMPGHEIRLDRLVGAGRGPRRASAPTAVTSSTRPPAVTIAPSSRRSVPAWNTVTPGTRTGRVETVDHVAGARAARDSPRPRARRSRTRRRGTRHRRRAARRGPTRGSGRRGRSRAAAPRPGTPGSPKRTLYSSTFGPSGVSMRPAYRTPRYSRVAAPQLRERRLDRAVPSPRRRAPSSTMRHRRVRAHAAGVRAGVAVDDALEVLRRRERHRVAVRRTSTSSESSGPLSPSSITTRAAGVAERGTREVARTASRASAIDSVTTTPLPAASPSVFTT